MDSQTIYGNKLGHYSLVKEAGRGGMSTVYEAVDTRLGRTVALKLLAVPPYLMPAEREALVGRLRREARAVGSLSHPNVVTIFDVGEQDGLHFLVMEYLDGVTLRARLDTGPLSAPEAADVLDQVAAGLDAVHAQGVLHRDIKPSNVMLLPGGRVKLMDFGVARQADDTTMTQAGTMVGSPAYMSPEQIEGHNATAASDIWSLGVLLYEMLAGKPPFTAATIASVLYQTAHHPAAPLPGVSAPVQKVLLKALEKDPANRYNTAGALAAAFRAAAAAKASSLTPPTAAAPAPRHPQRAVTGVKGGTTPAAAAPARREARWPLIAAGLLLIPAVTGAGYLLSSRGAQTSAPSKASAPPPKPAAQEKPAAAAKAVPKPESETRRTKTAERNNSPVVTIKEGTPPQPEPAEPQVPEATVREPERATARPERAVRRGPERVATTTAETETEPREQQTRRRRTRRESAADPVDTRPAPPVAPSAEEEPPARREAAAAAPDETPAPEADDAVPRLEGTWHGIHTRNRATLAITRHRGNDFSGTMTVRTNEGMVRLAVSGSLTPNGLVLRERRVLEQERRGSWDLGTNYGRLSGQGRMAGSGSDRSGRSYSWSFTR